MPRLTMPVAMTAKASMPGSRKSTAFSFVAGTIFSDVKKMSKITGTISVIRTLSPRRSVMSNSTCVCAQTCWPNDAAFDSDVTFVCSIVCVVICLFSLFSHFRARETQEQVLERTVAYAEFGKCNALVSQPGCQFRYKGWSRRSFDYIAARAHFFCFACRWQRRQLRAIKSSAGNEAHNIGILNPCQSVRRIHGNQSTMIDDSNAVGQALGFIHQVRGQ